HGVPQTGRRGVLLSSAALARNARSDLRLASSGVRPRALGHGDQYSLGVRLFALLSARQATRVTARNLSLSRGAARHRGVAAADRAGRAGVGGTRARDYGVRPPHQRLW